MRSKLNYTSITLLMLLYSASGFISKSCMRQHGLVFVKSEKVLLFHGFQDDGMKIKTSLKSSIQEDQGYYHPENKSRTVISRRRAFHKGSNRLMIILATALGVSKRISDHTAFGVDDIFHQNTNFTSPF